MNRKDAGGLRSTGRGRFGSMICPSDMYHRLRAEEREAFGLQGSVVRATNWRADQDVVSISCQRLGPFVVSQENQRCASRWLSEKLAISCATSIHLELFVVNENLECEGARSVGEDPHCWLALSWMPRRIACDERGLL